MLIQEPGDLREVRRGESLGYLLNHCLIFLFSLVIPNTSIQVVVTKMEGTERQQGGLLGDFRGDLSPPHRQLQFAGNKALIGLDPDLGEYGHEGSALAFCDGLIENNTIVNNAADQGGSTLYKCPGTIRNCIIWDNAAGSQLSECSEPTYSCIQHWTGDGEGSISQDPRFVDADNGNFRLLPASPCIDAGFNDPDLPERDIAGMHRIMFGGKSLTVDMGAYEFYINNLTSGPNPDQTTFTWSSLAEKTYSIFYTDDLLTWHVAVGALPSAGNETTSWTDDGSLTGSPPGLVPRRFYRLLENL